MTRLKTAKEATRSREDSDFTVLYFILLTLLCVFLFIGFYWLKQRWNRRFERQLQARIRHVKTAEFEKKKKDIDDKILKKKIVDTHKTVNATLNDCSQSQEEDEDLECIPLQNLDTKECIICFQDFMHGDVLSISTNAKCPHVYHAECITMWIISAKDGQNGCPTCRRHYLEHSECSEVTMRTSRMDSRESIGAVSASEEVMAEV
ncbi:hypothetical protein CTEN210_17760 [Chaetoceros tenuissimus]|uniref:RING-type domain-containing protein n=1 Tax=Chaetoceros tenuissimus TaxID=426638 RepID=A0AAD3DBA0_9STRA|nr:hypothetical protein CTEN210_17760 [Chaetoceros tenuissimus]